MRALGFAAAVMAAPADAMGSAVAIQTCWSAFAARTAVRILKERVRRLGRRSAGASARGSRAGTVKNRVNSLEVTYGGHC